MSVVSPYRVTPMDLRGLDKATRDGLQPLVDALNIVIQQLVKKANAAGDVITPVTLFTTTDLGAAYVDILNPLTAVPLCVQVASLNRTDGVPIDNLYGFWWTMTATGIRLLFVGLSAFTRYMFSVRVQ